jgi:hypothetical protein
MSAVCDVVASKLIVTENDSVLSSDTESDEDSVEIAVSVDV